MGKLHAAAGILAVASVIPVVTGLEGTSADALFSSIDSDE
jgi:hypothetical protein